jgi:hypothetical protein
MNKQKLLEENARKEAAAIESARFAGEQVLRDLLAWRSAQHDYRQVAQAWARPCAV